MRGSLPDMTTSRLYRTHVTSRPLAQRFLVQRRWQHTASGSEPKTKSEGGFIHNLNKIVVVGSAGSFLIGVSLAVSFMAYPDDDDLPVWMQKIRYHINKLRYQGLSHTELDVAQNALSELEKLNQGINNLKIIQEKMGNLAQAKALIQADYDNKELKLRNELQKQKNIIRGNQEKYQKDLEALQKSLQSIEQSTPEGVAIAIKNKKALEVILSCIGEQCVNDIHKFLASNVPSVNIVGNSPPHFKTNFATQLADALKSNLNPTVSLLNLEGSDIKTNNGLFVVMQGLKSNNTIKTLKLRNLDIGSNDETRSEIKAIADMLTVNITLEELDLYYTCIEKQDLAILGDALEKNQSLKKINLGGTYIKSISDIGTFVDRINKTRNDNNKITIEHTAS
jgi:hypothetical protein